MHIEQLYREVIMDHYKHPRHKGLVDQANYLTIHLNNPSCGDELTIQLYIENNTILDVRHLGTGCSICCSSASVMSEAIIGKTIAETLAIIHEFYEMIKGYPYDDHVLTGDPVVYQGVSQFPARIKCATLAWKAAETGLEQKGGDDEA